MSSGNYGVRVSRHPSENAIFRMEFVHGPNHGKVIEVDVRSEGCAMRNIPDDWQLMTAAPPGETVIVTTVTYSVRSDAFMVIAYAVDAETLEIASNYERRNLDALGSPADVFDSENGKTFAVEVEGSEEADAWRMCSLLRRACGYPTIDAEGKVIK